MRETLVRIATALEKIAELLEEKKQRSVKSKTARLFEISEADLEEAYALYPKKEGKAQGHKRLMSSMKKEELPLLKQALLIQIDKWKREGRDDKYIPMWSTWAGRWKECLDEVPVAQSLAGADEEAVLELFRR